MYDNPSAGNFDQDQWIHVQHLPRDVTRWTECKRGKYADPDDAARGKLNPEGTGHAGRLKLAVRVQYLLA